MATPCGGVLARTQALGLGGVENALNTTAKARSRLGFRRPNRFEHGEDIFGRDHVDRHGPQRRGILSKRHRPLSLVLLISEALALLGDNLICQLAERRDAPVLFALGDRVDAAAREPSPGDRLLAGFSETDLGIAAEPHLAGVALPKEA